MALVLGSFADEVSGDDDTSLKESRCLFCTVNLHLTLPLVSLLAFLLVRFAALRPSLKPTTAAKRLASAPHRSRRYAVLRWVRLLRRFATTPRLSRRSWTCRASAGDEVASEG